MTVFKEIRTTLLALALLLLIIGFLYPAILIGIGKVFFPHEAGGSILYDESKRPVGSKWIAQNFSSPAYFHPRPSHAGLRGFDAMASSASNLGPISKTLHDLLVRRAAEYRLENNLPSHTPIPVDAVTASGSGLDPHISIKNAYLQANRIAQARNVPVQLIIDLISQREQGRFLAIFGEPRLNVLLINIEMDQRF
jgi:K+-transporting ATPase ATPase C chain